MACVMLSLKSLNNATDGMVSVYIVITVTPKHVRAQRYGPQLCKPAIYGIHTHRQAGYLLLCDTDGSVIPETVLHVFRSKFDSIECRNASL